MCGVFALAKGTVCDLTQKAEIVVQGANIAPVDLVGICLEMIIAEGFQASQHCVDLAFGGEKCVEGFAVICGGQWVIGVAPSLCCIVFL